VEVRLRNRLADDPDPFGGERRHVPLDLDGPDGAQVAIGDLDFHPADVSVETGLVKYELVGWVYVRRSTGEHWGGVTRPAYDDIVVEIYRQHVDGTVLFKLLEDHRLKSEAFPGLQAHQVDGFTSEAEVYEQ